ncbi:DNA polymerase (family 10) [Halogranum gelatinilyticum]|uniref:DNA polymerase beta n=1 Tax=Halogranum gelatinilyticum TaxID=660521 RepID=A0A1G9QNW1_9EURY|nr:DNA polymerase/3'-5' exonuclease PolX [Halogranum gelatinilyticum]SDM11975.1 DNA polymerase (family 10) [Halogranum gelatinilyticum]
MSRNDEVATLLEEFADLLDAQRVEYKPRSYRRAAENIREYPKPIEQLAAEGQDEVEEISGVGDAISSKVVEYFETGTIGELEDLREELPVDMAGLTSVEGVGPKTVGDLYEALGITTLDELEAAAEAGEIQEIKGYGAKTEENILENIPFARQSRERELLGDARPLADGVLDYLRDVDAVDRADVAGSIRRWKETIGDVDVLVASESGEAVVDAFTEWPEADTTIEAGTSKASVRAGGIRVDLRVVVPDEFGSALQYFTGSKDHNVHLRNLAIDRDLKMNEYGIFDVSDVEDASDQRAGTRVGGKTEEEMYAALDLPLVSPELREDTGEIEAARDGDLPDLLALDDIRGDLHTHTDWSDGNNTIAEMVAGAAERGYDYHVVTDHATGPGMVGGVGLDDETLREQMDAVSEVAADADIAVLHGVEANIDDEGGVSVADDLLAELDLVVASPHSALGQDRETATDRIVRAIEHPSVDIIGHPTGRLINSRPGLELDYERVAEAAVEHGTALEVNANPHRLDLNDAGVRAAVEAGATIAVNTDAHRPETLDFTRYGVHTARRGWAEAADVLNTRDVDGLREFLH